MKLLFTLFWYVFLDVNITKASQNNIRIQIVINIQ